MPENNELATQEKSSGRNVAMVVNFAQLARLITQDLNKSNKPLTVFKKYTKEDVRRFLENPQANEDKLREISRFLYTNSQSYKRLIRHFSNSLTFDYTLEPIGLDRDSNPKKVKKNLLQTSDFIDNLNLKHEFTKVLQTAYRDDAFYGYEFWTPDSYYILKLDPKYCRISGVEDGVYNFSFDFSYFDNAAKKDELERLPSEFKKKHTMYAGDKKNKWIELDPKTTICIKIEEDLEYVVPPFAGVFEDVFDIVDYKSLRKQKEEIGNYKVLTQHIPLNEKSEEVNDFLIDMNTAIDFHNRAVESLPDQVGLVTSPMKFSEFSFEKDKVGSDGVAEAERNYWNSAGVSQLLFNSEKGGSIGLNRSIESDEAIMFATLRQLERWVNRKLKYLGGYATKFKVSYLDITRFNQKDVQDQLLKASQASMPTKMKLAASLGHSPSTFYNMAVLENDILGLHEILVPLASSHTGGMNGEGGRPKSKESDLGDAGSKTRDTGANDNRAD